FMDVFKYALLVMSVALIYLLSKIIIEKNENAISMAKILGFKNSEIASLYMLPTGIMVVIFAIISVFIGKAIIAFAFITFMMQMDGWFTFWISTEGMIGSILFVLIGYAIVSIVDYRRIGRIPLEEALKDIE
ncbi:MAG: ABC transporter permease, partial [Pseudobutyrivibrio sp.]|nr:ABC transporter permease [Pseudobutyrivibrio sp.]